jgi:hypothetical protein
MPDVALLIQSGFTPKKEWLERHFRVELEDKRESGGPEDQTSPTTYNPEEDQDLYSSIFGDDTSSIPGEESTAPAETTPAPEEEPIDTQEVAIEEQEG